MRFLYVTVFSMIRCPNFKHHINIYFIGAIFSLYIINIKNDFKTLWKMEKINILSSDKYEEIIDFIHKFPGLHIDCEMELKKSFRQINESTLTSILFNECNQNLKANYHKYQIKAPQFLAKFQNIASKSPYNETILITMAKNNKMPPTILSRLLVYEKYKDLTKSQVTKLLKNPHMIPDKSLGANVRVCLLSDNQEGPIMDIVRRCLGEEYELKLKRLATEAGMVFCDEGDLRRIGYDKTPDLKLALPCLYKGAVVNWIESKALFGDLKSHKRYIAQQLESYINRFGSGIVIYWFGYIEDILNISENGNSLIILNDFPEKEYLEFLKV